MDLTTASPAEIDTELATLHGRATAHRTARLQLLARAEQATKGRYPDAAYAQRLTEQANAELTKAQAVEAEMAPLEGEFIRRGGWTRAFVVADGHVHSSMDCSTCNNGMYPTQFGWVTEFSGKTEAEVIEAAGSRACTVCYPDAPVDAPAGRIFHADEVAAQAARDERAAKKAAADAKRAANAFGPYKTADRWGNTLDTVYKAKSFLTDGYSWGWDHPSFLPADRDAVAELLAAKLGTTTEAQLEAAATRAKNRG